MILTCIACKHEFDDQWRDTGCPHMPFRANGGNNVFHFKMDSHGPKIEYTWFVALDLNRDAYMAVPILPKDLDEAREHPNAIELTQELGDRLNLRGGVPVPRDRQLASKDEVAAYVRSQLERAQ